MNLQLAGFEIINEDIIKWLDEEDYKKVISLKHLNLNIPKFVYEDKVVLHLGYDDLFNLFIDCYLINNQLYYNCTYYKWKKDTSFILKENALIKYGNIYEFKGYVK